jgi:hypothetical protein
MTADICVLRGIRTNSAEDNSATFFHDEYDTAGAE